MPDAGNPSDSNPSGKVGRGPMLTRRGFLWGAAAAATTSALSIPTRPASATPVSSPSREFFEEAFFPTPLDARTFVQLTDMRPDNPRPYSVTVLFYGGIASIMGEFRLPSGKWQKINFGAYGKTMSGVIGVNGYNYDSVWATPRQAGVTSYHADGAPVLESYIADPRSLRTDIGMTLDFAQDLINRAALTAHQQAADIRIRFGYLFGDKNQNEKPGKNNRPNPDWTELTMMEAAMQPDIHDTSMTKAIHVPGYGMIVQVAGRLPFADDPNVKVGVFGRAIVYNSSRDYLTIYVDGESVTVDKNGYNATPFNGFAGNRQKDIWVQFKGFLPSTSYKDIIANGLDEVLVRPPGSNHYSVYQPSREFNKVEPNILEVGPVYYNQWRLGGIAEQAALRVAETAREMGAAGTNTPEFRGVPIPYLVFSP